MPTPNKISVLDVCGDALAAGDIIAFSSGSGALQYGRITRIAGKKGYGTASARVTAKSVSSYVVYQAINSSNGGGRGFNQTITAHNRENKIVLTNAQKVTDQRVLNAIGRILSP